MIIAEQKPLKELVELTRPFKKLLIVGCGECVTVCFAGGERETKTLALGLRLSARQEGREIDIRDGMILRQCEWEYLEPFKEKIKEVDAVVSTACGVGVQAMAEFFDEKRVIPGLNTSCMGMPVEQGIWLENCSGCGNCVLAYTGGICPVARCAKSLFNGPCGGSAGGRCEVSKDIACAWAQIYERLKKQGLLHLLKEFAPAKDWRPARDGGPRRIVREDLRLKIDENK